MFYVDHMVLIVYQINRTNMHHQPTHAINIFNFALVSLLASHESMIGWRQCFRVSFRAIHLYLVWSTFISPQRTRMQSWSWLGSHAHRFPACYHPLTRLTKLNVGESGRREFSVFSLKTKWNSYPWTGTPRRIQPKQTQSTQNLIVINFTNAPFM